jgi:diguanylate cyclase (GGDEF)-like protein
MLKYYSAVIAICAFSMVVLIVNTFNSNTLTREQKELFRVLFSIIMVAAVCEWLGVILDGRPGHWRFIHIVVKTLEFSLSPCIAVVFTRIIQKMRMKLIFAVLIFHAVLEVLSGIFGFIFYVDANNNYYHGKFYVIYILAYLLSLVFALYNVLKGMKLYQYSGAKQFLMIAILILMGVVINLTDSSIRITFFTLGIASSMLYIVALEMIQQTDGLTGLLNRRGFDNSIAAEKDECVILFMDVDSFKMVNDVYGHDYGDYALRTIGGLMRKYYATYGKCFRYGGDEFAVIVTKRMNEVKKANDSFRDELAQIKAEDGKMPGVSIGYAAFDPKKDILTDVVKAADAKMYAIKRERKENERRA